MSNVLREQWNGASVILVVSLFSAPPRGLAGRRAWIAVDGDGLLAIAGNESIANEAYGTADASDTAPARRRARQYGIATDDQVIHANAQDQLIGH